MVDQLQTNGGMCVTKDGVVPSGTDAACCCGLINYCDGTDSCCPEADGLSAGDLLALMLANTMEVEIPSGMFSADDCTSGECAALEGTPFAMVYGGHSGGTFYWGYPSVDPTDYHFVCGFNRFRIYVEIKCQSNACLRTLQFFWNTLGNHPYDTFSETDQVVSCTLDEYLFTNLSFSDATRLACAITAGGSVIFRPA